MIYKNVLLPLRIFDLVILYAYINGKISGTISTKKKVLNFSVSDTQGGVKLVGFVTALLEG